jgi:hypothetical protein
MSMGGAAHRRHVMMKDEIETAYHNMYDTIIERKMRLPCCMHGDWDWRKAATVHIEEQEGLHRYIFIWTTMFVGVI